MWGRQVRALGARAGLEVVAQRMDRGFTSRGTAACAALNELGFLSFEEDGVVAGVRWEVPVEIIDLLVVEAVAGGGGGGVGVLVLSWSSSSPPPPPPPP